MSINRRIRLFIVSVTLLLSLGFGYTYWETKSTWNQQLEDTGISSVNVTAAAVDEYMGTVFSAVTNTAEFIKITGDKSGYSTAGKFQNILDNFYVLNRGHGVEALFLGLEADCSIAFSGSGKPVDMEGIPATSRYWYQSAKKAGGITVTEPYISPRDKKLHISVVQPIYSPTAGFLGVVGADIDTWKIASHLSVPKLWGDGMLLIAGSEGTLLAYPDKAAIMKESIHVASKVVPAELAAIGERMVSRRSGHADFRYKGQFWRLFYTSSQKGFLIGLAYPRNAIESVARVQALQQLSLAVIMLVFLTLPFIPSLMSVGRFGQKIINTASRIDNNIAQNAPESVSEMALSDLAKDIREQLEEAKLPELRNFYKSFYGTISLLMEQQHTLFVFTQNMEFLNALLQDSNIELEQHEVIWAKTLEVAKAMTNLKGAFEDTEQLCSTIAVVTEAFGVSILVPDESGDFLKTYASYGQKEFVQVSAMPIASSNAGFAYLEGEEVWVENEGEPGQADIITEINFPLIHQGRQMGVLQVCFNRWENRRRQFFETLGPVASTIAGFIAVVQHQDSLRSSYRYLAEKLMLATNILDDGEEQLGFDRLAKSCQLLAAQLGRTEQEQGGVAFFSRLHDIGEVQLSQEILNSDGVVTSDEFEEIKKHTVWGAELIGKSEWLVTARNICLSHHEKWDGSGYPYGLSEEAIPWEAQVVALADVYDALRSKKPYRRAYSHQEAVSIILNGDEKGSPEHFSPALRDAFAAREKEFEAIYAETGQSEEKTPDGEAFL